MKRDVFGTYEELSDYMIDKAQNGVYTVAVLFHDDAIELLRQFMRYDDTEVSILDIEPVDLDGYDKEYYVSIADDMMISVEPAYSDGKYLSTDADLTLIDGDASSAIIVNLPDSKCREIYIGDRDDEQSEKIQITFDLPSFFDFLF